MRTYKKAECINCKREKLIAAKGLCRSCYQRFRKNGSFEYKRVKHRCSINGCEDFVVSHGLCDKHRQRLRKHGSTDQTRPDSWGAIYKHPLGNAWNHLNRYASQHKICDEWKDDFLQFAMDVGEKPSKKHRLFVADDSRPIGPDNFVWKTAMVQRADGEDDRTYYNRVARTNRAVNIDAFKGYDLKKRFGLSIDDYSAMLESQNGVCAICGNPEHARKRNSNEIRSLAVDHCHETGKVRGLLCTNCNKGIGHFKDDVEIMKNAISYLENGVPHKD